MPCVPQSSSTSRLGTFSSLSATARPPSAPNPLPAHITHCCSSSASSSTAGQSNQNRSRYDRVTQMLFTLETNRRIWIQSSHGKSQNKSCSLYSVSLALAACPSIPFAFNRDWVEKGGAERNTKEGWRCSVIRERNNSNSFSHGSKAVMARVKEQVTHASPRNHAP